MPVQLKYSSSKDFQGNGDWVLPDVGFYTFELTDVREPRTEPNPFKEGEMRTSIALEWTIRGDEEFDGVDFLNFYTLSLHEKANLTPFVLALRGGKAFEEDEDLDLEEYIGRKIQGTITHREKKDKSGFRPIITSPVPFKAKKRRPAPVVVEEDEDEEMPPTLQQRRTAPAEDDFEIPEGFAVVGGSM